MGFDIQMKQVFYLRERSGEKKRKEKKTRDKEIRRRSASDPRERSPSVWNGSLERRGARSEGWQARLMEGKAQRGLWEEDPTSIKLIINNGQIL